MSLSRRGLLGAFLAAPAIIRTPGLLMPVKRVPVIGGTVTSIVIGKGLASSPIANWGTLVLPPGWEWVPAGPHSGHLRFQGPLSLG